jgi:hypothetical protein
MIVVFVEFSPIFLLGILIFKGLTARRLYKPFGVKGLNIRLTPRHNMYVTGTCDASLKVPSFV